MKMPFICLQQFALSCENQRSVELAEPPQRTPLDLQVGSEISIGELSHLTVIGLAVSSFGRGIKKFRVYLISPDKEGYLLRILMSKGGGVLTNEITLMSIYKQITSDFKDPCFRDLTASGELVLDGNSYDKALRGLGLIPSSTEYTQSIEYRERLYIDHAGHQVSTTLTRTAFHYEGQDVEGELICVVSFVQRGNDSKYAEVLLGRKISLNQISFPQGIVA